VALDVYFFNWDATQRDLVGRIPTSRDTPLLAWSDGVRSLRRAGAWVTGPTSDYRCKVFTDSAIRRAPDCVGVDHRRICLFVATTPSFALSDADKLDALRRFDQFREWRSLDDQRFCLVCGKIITGQKIQVVRGTRGDGPQWLSCPTERCNSIPMDWVLPTNEILAVAETARSKEERNVAPLMVPDRGVEQGLASQLKKLAMRFKLVF
jgi:hypothetical protein